MELRISPLSRAFVCALLVAAVALCGCGSRTDASSGGDPVILRVAAPFGLTEFELDPTAGGDGTSAAAMELVLEPVRTHVDVEQASPRAFRLQLRPESSLSIAEASTSLRATGLKSVEVVGEAGLIVNLATESAAAVFEETARFDAGPFVVERAGESMVRLRRRASTTIDVIEIREMSADDEWRQLHGRQLDVIPVAEERRKAEFEALESVRIVPIEPSAEIALYMNTRSDILSDVRVRRAIARALNRPALARVGCGTVACQSRPPAAPDPGTVELPNQVSLRVHADHAEGVRAARVVRSQLRDVGIEVEVMEVDLVADLSVLQSQATQLWIAPNSLGQHNFRRFLSPSKSGGFSATGYAEKEYDHAVEEGDLTRAAELLARDVPVTPLYVMRHFAVIDRRFCGEVEPESQSWRWLAELHPCESKGDR